MHSIIENANAVLLPAFSGIKLSDPVLRFLDQGGCSLLPGETREEYLARKMSIHRRQHESVRSIQELVALASSRAGKVLVAVDQEPGGICRLEHLICPCPSREEIESSPPAELEKLWNRMAASAFELGINIFLAPVLDLQAAPNPWLKLRTLSPDPQRVAELGSAYIRGVQATGVAATAKHFPGYSILEKDPATDERSINTEPEKNLREKLIPFTSAVEKGVEAVMLGPAIVQAVDPDHPASTSARTVKLLREALGFDGLIITDDLDSPSLLRNGSMLDTAVMALRAGADLLLLADIGPQLQDVAQHIVKAVQSGELGEERLNDAAARVRAMAEAKYVS